MFTCPRCKKGKLFSGFLTIAPACTECGLNLSAYEKGDGPAFFGIVVVGFLVTALAGYVEIVYQPPYWLHAALWLPLVAILSLLSLRFAKAWLVQSQYTHQGDSFG